MSERARGSGKWYTDLVRLLEEEMEEKEEKGKGNVEEELEERKNETVIEET